jgi:hypothetical protein
MPDDFGDDDRLLAALGEALAEAAAVPADVIAAGRAAYAWRDIDAEYAALLSDSADDPTGVGEHAPALIRADRASRRILTFTSARLTVEVEIGPGGLQGQFVPPQPGAVDVCAVTGEVVSVPVDDLGYFAVNAVQRASFRLRCRVADRPDVLTSWILP